MSMFPLFEIIFYIATLFAPVDATKITITHEGSSAIAYSHTDDGWKSSADNSIWKVDGLTVQHGDDLIDVSGFVKGADTHKWCDQSILKLSGNMEILKVADGYWVYPNGIDSPENKWVVKYEVESNE